MIDPYFYEVERNTATNLAGSCVTEDILRTEDGSALEVVSNTGSSHLWVSEAELDWLVRLSAKDALRLAAVLQNHALGVLDREEGGVEQEMQQVWASKAVR